MSNLQDLRWANPNLVWSTAVAQGLVQAGVKTVCISPGSRSTPLVVAIAAEPQLEAIVQIDERSSSFFALGLAKARNQPVALLCTSGTAAANYFAAIIEAHYSQVPLLVLTADRPPELRDCGAGQTIDQIKLYGNYVRYFFEVGKPEITEQRLSQVRSLILKASQISQTNPAGVVHLNFAFADPLAPIAVAFTPAEAQILPKVQNWQGKPLRIMPQVAHPDLITDLAQVISDRSQGLIMVGGGHGLADLEPSLIELAARSGYPLLTEATGINRRAGLSTYDSFLRSLDLEPQLILRFGAVPTSKAWHQWLSRYPNCKQIVIGNPINNDPSHRASEFWPVDPADLSDRLSHKLAHHQPDYTWHQQFQALDHLVKTQLESFIQPISHLFEGKIYHLLAKCLPAHSQIFVASSSAIRDLDTFFHPQQPVRVLANRGANGIDGTLSTALGASLDRPSCPNLLIIGDLAFYHDLNGLLAAKQYQIDLTVILINNNGGGIFQMLPIAAFNPPFEQFFTTPHHLDFAPIIQAYGGEYDQIHSWAEFIPKITNALARSGLKVLELKTNAEYSQQLRQAWDQQLKSE
ncbi:MAG: 2-succinyl-5-enolpyruvyl-6-hydroxy-3-cyclohexene-1-carboxylic-acid synthase [Pseudanabaenaceae cyanobacterium bins.68]|nr:2-succinyl-5-enolpyruvyl-6-hydroxy-3-cyclohexene-1-carboxylic-acid synthase [Pseudanabaenaceae cyanobacterium bins.68]